VEDIMSVLEPGAVRCVQTDDLPWRPSTMAPGVSVTDIAVTAGWEMQLVRFEPGARFPVHTHEQPEFLFILEGELVQAGRRLGRGWASVASPGSVDADVYSEAGCVFVLVDRA
jgi:anti-sigma factor ChrR (cupin superfamily)